MTNFQDMLYLHTGETNASKSLYEFPSFSHSNTH